MGRKGPLLTLLGGAALASVLIALNVHASASQPKANVAAGPSAAASPSATLPSATLPSATPPSAASPAGAGALVSAPAVAYRATYAGYTTGGAATVAIAVRDGVAIAYVCDGSRVEAWLRGTATGGQLNLSGTHNSSLTGTYGKGVATGKVNVGAKHWTFRARAVYPPSGLYKAAATVRNKLVEVGWIQLDGRQTGVETVDGTPAPASTLDTGTRTATVNGETVNAVAVDGASGTGF
jgi:serine/threonine-protein kinase